MLRLGRRIFGRVRRGLRVGWGGLREGGCVTGQVLGQAVGRRLVVRVRLRRLVIRVSGRVLAASFDGAGALVVGAVVSLDLVGLVATDVPKKADDGQ